MTFGSSNQGSARGLSLDQSECSISRFCKKNCSAPTTLPESESNLPGELEVGRVFGEFERLCENRIPLRTAGRYELLASLNEMADRSQVSPLQQAAVSPAAVPEPWQEAACWSGTKARGVLKHRGLGAPLQGREATHRPQFTFRFEGCVKRHKSGGRRGVSSASRYCAPSRAAWTTQGSGAAGKSADPLMCNVRARIIEGGNKVTSCKGF